MGKILDLFKTTKKNNKTKKEQPKSVVDISLPTNFTHITSGDPFGKKEEVASVDVENVLPSSIDVEEKLQEEVKLIEAKILRGMTFIQSTEDLVKGIVQKGTSFMINAGNEVLDTDDKLLEVPQKTIARMRSEIEEAKSIVDELKNQLQSTKNDLNALTKGYKGLDIEKEAALEMNKKLQSQNNDLVQHKKQALLLPQLKKEKEDLAVENAKNFQRVQKRDQALLTNKKAIATTDTTTYIALAASVASAIVGGFVQIPFIKNFIQQYPIVNVIFSILGIGGTAAATTVGGVKLATYSKSKEAKQAYDRLQTDIAEQGQEQGVSLAA